MEDRPDLIQSELTGMAFDSLQCVFRPADIEVMFTQEPPEPVLNADIYLFIDLAAGGPQSDYAILSFQRIKGLVTVSDFRRISANAISRHQVQIRHHINEPVHPHAFVAEPRLDHLMPHSQKETLCLASIQRFNAYFRQTAKNRLFQFHVFIHEQKKQHPRHVRLEFAHLPLGAQPLHGLRHVELREVPVAAV